MRLRFLTILAFSGAALAAIPPVDSSRGEKLFQTLSCIQCHSVNGKGGTVGPDLSRRLDRNYTAATFASLMWNHAPAMWTAMRERKISMDNLDEQSTADLFAFFYAARFFDTPGDAARGKRLFAERNCSHCHGLTQAKVAGAKPVSEWQSIGDPVAMAAAMWNHAAEIRAQTEKQGLKWQRLSGQDLVDILVYVRNLPATRGKPSEFKTASSAQGESLFASKGCAACHATNLPLPPRMQHKTLTDIAAEMWNHQPAMAARAGRPLSQLTPEEMREVVSYIWAQAFFVDSGNAARGERVFTSKSCAACHNDPSTGAPSLSGASHPYSSITIVTALWRHGPTMHDLYQKKNLFWPRFDGNEMSDLIAYLNTRKPAESASRANGAK